MPDIVDFWGQTSPGVCTPADIVAFCGAAAEDRVDSNPVSPTYGHFCDTGGNSVLVGSDGLLALQNHKQTWLIMAKGLTDANAVTGLATCRLALASIEAWLSYRSDHMGIPGLTGPDGSFPAQKGGSTKKQSHLHNKTIAAAPIAESLRAFRDSAFYTGADATLCDTLIVQLEDFTYWLADDGPGSDVDEFFTRIHNYNQAMSICLYFEVAGVLHDDPDLRAKAQVRLQQVFDEGISEDHVIQEAAYKDNIGFDGSYMAFSLRSLAAIYLSLDAGTWKDTVEAQLDLCIARWLQTINVDTGFITDMPGGIPWTRVHETVPAKPSDPPEPQGWTWDNFTYTSLLLNYCRGDSVVPDELPDLIQEHGKNFGKQEGDPLDPVLYIILEEADIAAVEGLSATVDWAALGRVERQGGGACAGYPGGTIPAEVWILPEVVLYLPEHAEHEAALAALPTLDILEPGFPPEL